MDVLRNAYATSTTDIGHCFIDRQVFQRFAVQCSTHAASLSYFHPSPDQLKHDIDKQYAVPQFNIHFVALDIDRGVKDWCEFFTVIADKYPQLYALALDQNYAKSDTWTEFMQQLALFVKRVPTFRCMIVEDSPSRHVFNPMWTKQEFASAISSPLLVYIKHGSMHFRDHEEARILESTLFVDDRRQVKRKRHKCACESCTEHNERELYGDHVTF